jgi:hypothetical protein
MSWLALACPPSTSPAGALPTGVESADRAWQDWAERSRLRRAAVGGPAPDAALAAEGAQLLHAVARRRRRWSGA